MIRGKIFAGKEDKQGFRWRGGEVSRLEGFSDAVFAFAITLLVVSLEVPNNFNELLRTMQGFIAFAVCVVLLMIIWHSHYLYFRRYGLNDSRVIVLNSILLFVILFYIYPLKFLFNLLVSQFIGTSANTFRISIQPDQTPMLMIIYSLGYLAVFSTLILMHLHAYRKREELELNKVEIMITRIRIQYYLIHIIISLLSIIIALVGGPAFSLYSGLIYCLLGPLFTVHGKIMGKRLRLVQASENIQ